MKHLCFILWFLLFAPTAFGQTAITQIYGGSILAPAEGACVAPKTFTMVDGGTITSITGAASTSAGFKASPVEANGGGRGYAVSYEAGTNTIRLVTYLFTSGIPVENTTTNISVANNPDLASQVRANVYNPSNNSGKFVFVGTQIVAPCDVTRCLHFRSFDSNSTIDNVTANPGATPNSGAYIGHVTSDGVNYFVAYSTGAVSHIAKFTSSYIYVSQIASTPNLYGDLTSDDTYVYATINLAGIFNIRRIRISDMSFTDFALFGGVNTASLFHLQGFLYAGQTANIVRVNAATMTTSGTLALGGAEGPLSGGWGYDTLNDKLYVVTSDAGTATNYRRIRRSTFTNEQTVSRALAPQSFGVGFDFIHQDVYSVTVGANLLLTKIDLCS